MRRTFAHILLIAAIALLLPAADGAALSPTATPRLDWEIAPGIRLSYNDKLWRADSEANQLQSKAAPGCALSLHAGSGIPEGWKQRRVIIARGATRMIRTTYYDSRWRIQFAVYRYTRPNNLDYLNSEGVRLTPPNNVQRSWRYCRYTAEQVLATARRVGE